METNKDHFDKIYWFCIYVINIGLLMIAGLIWHPPKDQTIANVSFGFISGLVTAALSYVIGGSIPTGKKPDQPGTTTADISATVTTSNDSTKN